MAQLLINSTVNQLGFLILAVKKAEVVSALQRQYFYELENPVKTKRYYKKNKATPQTVMNAPIISFQFTFS